MNQPTIINDLAQQHRDYKPSTTAPVSPDETAPCPTEQIEELHLHLRHLEQELQHERQAHLQTKALLEQEQQAHQHLQQSLHERQQYANAMEAASHTPSDFV
jgi:chromosome segregation ATPase